MEGDTAAATPLVIYACTSDGEYCKVNVEKFVNAVHGA
jgi:hypothetical protein